MADRNTTISARSEMVISRTRLPLGSTLFVRDSGGRYRRASTAKILETARSVAIRALPEGTLCSDAGTVAAFLTARLRGLRHEVFACLFLDNGHRLIEYVELFRGTVDGASVYPREVLQEAMERNACAVVFAHNHPSGRVAASEADELITEQLRQVLAMVDIRVLDHIIVAREKWLSFAQQGKL